MRQQNLQAIEYDSGTYIEGIQSQSAVSYGNKQARIHNLRIVDMMGRSRNVLHTGIAYRYCYEVEFLADAKAVSFGMLIKEPRGVELGGATNERTDLRAYSAGDRITVLFEFNCRFLPGTYFGNAGVMGTATGHERQYLHRIVDAIMFRVEARASIEVGYVSLDAELNISRIER